MIITDREKKIDALTEQIPSLSKIPREDRLMVFKKAFKSSSYRFFLFVVFLALIFLFYLNFDDFTNNDNSKKGGIIATSIHFIQESGTSFLLPFFIILGLIKYAKNYFVGKEINSYLYKAKK